MKDYKRNVLLISHDTLLTRNLARGLEEKGNYTVKIAALGQAAVRIYKQTTLDLALYDVCLGGSLGSDDTIRQLSLLSPINVIFLTEPGKDVPDMPDNPATTVAYLNKSIGIDELLQTIDSVTNTINKSDTKEIKVNGQEKPLLPQEPKLKKNRFGREVIFMIDDSIFIKCNYQFMKVPIADILLFEANNTYVTIITTSRKFVLRLTLSSLLDRLNSEALLRVHRSFAINVHKIESFTEHEVSISQHKVPIGRHFQQQFIAQFQLR